MLKKAAELEVAYGRDTMPRGFLGLEAFAAGIVNPRLRLRADYTYTEARDDTAGLALLRRPVNKAKPFGDLVADRQNDRDDDVLICEPLGRR
jgi:hypothetical protein